MHAAHTLVQSLRLSTGCRPENWQDRQSAHGLWRTGEHQVSFERVVGKSEVVGAPPHGSPKMEMSSDFFPLYP